MPYFHFFYLLESLIYEQNEGFLMARVIKRLLSRFKNGEICEVRQSLVEFQEHLKVPLRKVLYKLAAEKKISVKKRDATPYMYQWLIEELYERTYLVECRGHDLRDSEMQRIFYELMNQTNGGLETFFGRYFINPAELEITKPMNLIYDAESVKIRFRKGNQ